MVNIGMSTGAVTKGNWKLALKHLNDISSNTIELSALRESELISLINEIDPFITNKYKYIFFHVPSKLSVYSEKELIKLLNPIIEKQWPLIVHPNIIQDFTFWKELQSLVCIENMDVRKPTGRTVSELHSIFEKLPDASFCFDIGHARQIDRTMSTAFQLLNAFQERLKVIHFSEVDFYGKHHIPSIMALLSFQSILPMINTSCPVIIEAPLEPRVLQTGFRKLVHFLHNPQVELLHA